MRNRGSSCRPVSVSLSVTLVYCIQTAKDIVKLFSPPDSPILLVFWAQTSLTSFKGNTLSGIVKYTLGMKIFRFSTEIAVYIGNSTK